VSDSLLKPGISRRYEVVLEAWKKGSKGRQMRAAIIAIMIVAILWLHYFTLPERGYQHAVHRTLFYLPLILGGLWFGLRGALLVCGTVLVLFAPYAIIHWKGLFLQEFDLLLEGILFVTSAIVLGLVVERERKERKKRVEAERLAAVGKAVSEVAHDMKTPLMAIGGFASQVAGMIADDHPGQKKLKIVMLETKRLESMVREMLQFGRPLDLALSQASLSDIIQECMEVSNPIAKARGVELEAHFASASSEMRLDTAKMKQVFLNLITNAVQASPAGERIIISTARQKKAVIVEVSDCGCGIKEEDRGNIFRPFFTTKKDGTGLGLAIVQKVVEGHGGDVSFRPNPQNGVTFTVRLPPVRNRPER
jgi:two-component system sensor histidine kinase HydH